MIRYDKKFNNEIRSIVNKYNAKINRLSKSNNSNILPDKINKDTLNQIKNSVTTRKELRSRLKDLENFTKRGGEKLVSYNGKQLPSYQKKLIIKYKTKLTKQLNKREKFNKTTHATVEGKKQPFTIAQQFDEETKNIESLRKQLLHKDLKNLSQSDVKKYINSLISNTQPLDLKSWQQNYADMILDTAYVYGVPHSKIIGLREKLLSLDPKQFDKLYKTEATIKSIVYYYKQTNDLGVDTVYEEMQEDALSIFNSLFDNIDDILTDYE